jgi:hypothetical protein
MLRRLICFLIDPAVWKGREGVFFKSWRARCDIARNGIQGGGQWSSVQRRPGTNAGAGGGGQCNASGGGGRLAARGVQMSRWMVSLCSAAGGGGGGAGASRNLWALDPAQSMSLAKHPCPRRKQRRRSARQQTNGAKCKAGKLERAQKGPKGSKRVHRTARSEPLKGRGGKGGGGICGHANLCSERGRCRSVLPAAPCVGGHRFGLVPIPRPLGHASCSTTAPRK